MAYVNEIHASRIADPTKLGEKIFIDIPQLHRKDKLVINGWEVKLPDEYFKHGDNLQNYPK